MKIALLDHENVIDWQRLGKDFERLLRLLFQENLKDNHKLEHGGQCDRGTGETVIMILTHVLKVQIPYRGTFLTEMERDTSPTSVSAGDEIPPR